MTGRLPRLLPSELSDEQRALYDEITGGPRSGGPQLFRLVDADGALHGPFGAMLLAPGVGGALQALGAAVRYGTSLGDRAREAAVVVVAVHWASAFELYAHVPLARAAGLDDEELSALLEGRPWPGTDVAEAAVVRAARALVDRRDLDDEEHAALVAAVGVRGAVELVTLVGYYAALALQLRVARVPAPEA